MSQLQNKCDNLSVSQSPIKLPIGDNNVECLDEPSLNQLILLDQQYRVKLAAKKQAAERKQLQSKAIGKCKKKGEDVSALIQTMQLVSKEVKDIDQEIKALKKMALALFNSNAQSTLQANSGASATQADQPSKFEPAAQTVDSANPDISICHINGDTASDEEIKQWQDYASKQPRCSIYHNYSFRRIINQTMGHNSHYLIAKNAKGDVSGLFPAIQLNSRLFGHSLVSIPFFNYGGPIADDQSIEKLLIDAMAKHAKSIGAESLEIRDTHERTGYATKDHKVSMILPLPDSADTLWEKIGSKVRAQIKKADQNQPKIQFGKQELLNDFYHIFATNMRDLGTPVYAKSFFRSIIENENDATILAVVYINNEPVSCAFLLGDKDTLEIPWASTLRKANRSNANMYMYWKILSFACGKSYAFFDFGRSSKDASTYKFKKQWGAKATPLYWHYWLNENQELPQVNPDNPKFRLLISVWKRLPLWLSQLIGPMVVKYIP